MGKKILISIVILFVATALAAGVGYYWYQSKLGPVNAADDTKQTFTITQTESAVQILTRLRNENLINSLTAAKIYLRLSNQGTNLRPGVYLVSPSQSLPEVIKALQTEPVGVKITFPEGWRREQYALRLKANFPDFDMQGFLNQSASVEGRLFPDTYIFPRLVTPEKVISTLTANFLKKTGVTDQDVVILASMIEREAKKPEERPMVASILKNRLADNEGLYIDATIQYGRDSDMCKIVTENCKFWTPITNTKYETPYNTYLYPGLPPGPISNPGKASIDAVLNPAETDFKYYLTDPQGVTHYAKTLPEHNANVDKYLRP